MPNDSIAPNSLSVKVKLTYGIGALSGSFPSNLFIFFFLFFLTDAVGISPGLAGSVILVGKIWDAINDPIIGWLSDHTHSRWGRRYPWMLYGSIPLGLSFFLLWFIPSIKNQWGLWLYYSAVIFCFYLAFTAVLLPYTTLSAELTDNYDERTRLISFRSAFSIGGSISSLILAQIVFNLVKNTQQQYLLLGGISALIAIVAVFLCFWGTYPEYRQQQQKKLEAKKDISISFWAQFRLAFTNRPFLYVMGIYLCSWLSVQLIASILPYYVTNCMNLPEKHFSQMAIAVQGTALIMMFVWTFLSRRLDKKIIYCLATPFTIIGVGGFFFLQPGQIVAMYALGMIAGVGIATAYLIPWSMLPDVIDFDELNTGERREGIFFGLLVQLQKVGIAAAFFLVGKILDWLGYIPGGEVQQPESALLAIRWLIAPIPSLILVMGLICAYFYPINRLVHQDILSELNVKRINN